MFLSKLTMNQRSARARRDLANPYEMHRTLSWAVSEAIRARQERLLWRVEPVRSGPPVVLVQTLTKPDWGALFQRHPDYAVLDPMSPKAFEPHFRSGRLLRFRLKANPSVKRMGKRYGLLSREDKMEWLQWKLTTAGCKLVAGVVVSEGRIRAIRHDLGTGALPEITIYAALFEGVLQVLDPEAARAAIARGIGPAKGFGLGLLSVAPVG